MKKVSPVFFLLFEINQAVQGILLQIKKKTTKKFTILCKK